MPKISPKILKGFKDYFLKEMAERERLIEIASSVYRKYGFTPLETPALEYAEILLGKYGKEGEKQLYRFRDPGQRDVALRFDLTVPLARVVAMYPELPRPYKRYQIAPVWRAEKPQKGRLRQFYQCDADIVGVSDLAADTECILIMNELMEKVVGKGEFVIKINNRKILNGLVEILELPSVQISEFLRILDKLPKVGKLQTKKALQNLGLSQEKVNKTFEFIEIEGRPDESLENLKEIFKESKQGKEGIAELIQIRRYLKLAKVEENACIIDLSIARGLEYYTGTVFETFINDAPQVGSVMSGGRFDKLIGMFSDKDIPAVGFSFGLDRFISILSELPKRKEGKEISKFQTQVLITCFNKNYFEQSFKVSQMLREKNINCELYLEKVTLKKQLKYANKREIPFSIFIGPDEVKRKGVIIKEMKTGKQEFIKLQNLVSYFLNS